MKLFLIRHAESSANTKGIYQGQTYETGLSPLGIKQAETLKNRLSNEKINTIYSSPSLRCTETVKPLSVSKDLKITTNAALLEINHGDWEGKTKEQIEKTFPGQLMIWKKQPSKIRMPNGEGLFEVKKRTETFLEGLKEKYENESVLICTHDAALRVVLAPILNIDLDDIWEIPIDSAAVTIVSWTSPKIIITLNDDRHLKDLLSDKSKHAL